MKNYGWILLSGGLLGMAFAQGACSSDTGGNTGGTGGSLVTTTSSSTTSTTTTTTSTTTTTTSSTGVTTGTGGTGGAADCTGLLNPSDCATCIEGQCCAELAACAADADCPTCTTDPTTAGCDTNAVYAAYNTCSTGNCNTECNPVSECNPVTNEGCTGAGEACDLNSSGIFSCFPPLNDALMCAACSNTAGPYCAPGMRCNEDANGGACTHFCCTDADCGTGTCDMASLMLPNGVGICLGGTSDAGTALASCDSPATPPSMGSCYMP